MPRPRKPTNILALGNAFKEHPARYVDRELEPPSIGDVGEPPDDFTQLEAMVWRRTKVELSDGLAGMRDRSAFAALIKLIAHFEDPETEDPLKDAFQGRLWQAFGHFGMTPSSRSRVQVAKKKDEVGQFANLRKAG